MENIDRLLGHSFIIVHGADFRLSHVTHSLRARKIIHHTQATITISFFFFFFRMKTV